MVTTTEAIILAAVAVPVLALGFGNALVRRYGRWWEQ